MVLKIQLIWLLKINQRTIYEYVKSYNKKRFVGFKCNLTPLPTTNDLFFVGTYLDHNNKKHNSQIAISPVVLQLDIICNL